MKSLTNSRVHIIGDQHLKAFQVFQKNKINNYAVVKIDKNDVIFIDFFDTKGQAQFYSYNLAPRRQIFIIEVNKWIPWIVA